MAIAQNFIDQYSVICVFGSVVGCVIVPLITQSIESLIFSAIVVTLTAQTLSRRMVTSADPPVKEERRRIKKEEVKVKKKREKVSTSVQDVEVIRRHREEDWKKSEEQRLADKERRFEEKREKKARKREERMRKKEEEQKEKEREETLRKEWHEQRTLRKQQEKQKKLAHALGGPLVCSLSQVESLASLKPLCRERKPSSSSSTSSHSTHSHPHSSRSKTHRHAHPTRASSDPSLASHHSLTSHTPSPQPSPTKGWQALPPRPMNQVPPRFLHSNERLQRVNHDKSFRHPHNKSNRGNHNGTVNTSLPPVAPPLSCAQAGMAPVGVAPVNNVYVGNGRVCRPGPPLLIHPELAVASHLMHQKQQAAWRAASDFTENTLFPSFYPHMAPAHPSAVLPGRGSPSHYETIGASNYYSLFSDQRLPFGNSLFSGEPSPPSPLSPSSQSSTGSVQPGNDLDTGEKREA